MDLNVVSFTLLTFDDLSLKKSLISLAYTTAILLSITLGMIRVHSLLEKLYNILRAPSLLLILYEPPVEKVPLSTKL